jgi:hypothetical protein
LIETTRNASEGDILLPKTRGAKSGVYDVRDPEPNPIAKSFRLGLTNLLNRPVPPPGSGAIRNWKNGVYLFYDFYRLPLYVGKTEEGFGERLTVHLGRRRSDAVATFNLDVSEVAEVEVWPLTTYKNAQDAKLKTAQLEWAVHQYAIGQLRMAGVPFPVLFNPQAVAEANDPATGSPIALPQSVRGLTYQPDVREQLMDTDVRIARRIQNLSNLATNIVDRERFTRGSNPRRTLLAQLYRVQRLVEAAVIESNGWPQGQRGLPVVTLPAWYPNGANPPTQGAMFDL